MLLAIFTSKMNNVEFKREWKVQEDIEVPQQPNE